MLNEHRPRELSAGELFRDHATFVARFLHRLGVPAEAIDDATQDVFLLVHQRGGYRPGPAKPTTYLAVIASNLASNARRQRRRRAARECDAAIDELRADGDDPALRAEQHESLRRLRTALSQLEPALRETLLLADVEGETAPSIAHATGVPVGTVYWRLHEARKKLKRAAKRLLTILGWLGIKGSAEARELVTVWRGAGLELELARGLAAAKLSWGVKVAGLVAGSLVTVATVSHVRSDAPRPLAAQQTRGVHVEAAEPPSPVEDTSVLTRPNIPPATARPSTARVERTRPPPSRDTRHDALAEARALKHAHGLLATDPARALELMEVLSRSRFEGYLSEEREYVRVMALHNLGRRAEAERAAARFFSRYPESAFRERVGAAQADADGE